MKKIIIDRGILHAIGGGHTLFERGGIVCSTARTSEEILNLHGVMKADLIVTDVSLPLMGGLNLCSAIRNDAELKKVSLVMLCDGDEASLTRCREAGVNAVIPKPVEPSTLFLRVSELLVIPRRKDMRVLLRVSVHGANASSFIASSRNISISGMLLETDRVLKAGDRIVCSFNIAHSEISVEGLVSRAHKAASGRRRYGVKFTNYDTKSMVVIDHFVQAQGGR